MVRMSEPVHSLTDAPERHSAEQTRRMVRYAVSMGIRILCFILAVVLQNWMSWVLLAAAVILPYVAVVAANAGADRYARGRDAGSFVDRDPLLTSGSPSGASGPAAESAASSASDQQPPRQWWEDEEDETPSGTEPPRVIPGVLESTLDEEQQPEEHRRREEG